MVVGAYPFEDPEEPKNFRKTIQVIFFFPHSWIQVECTRVHALVCVCVCVCVCERERESHRVCVCVCPSTQLNSKLDRLLLSLCMFHLMHSPVLAND